MRTQDYARRAFKKIEAQVDREDKTKAKEYGQWALKFPTLMLQAGLAQASGFLLAKKQTEYLVDLADLVAEGLAEGPTADEFHQRIIDSDLAAYQRLTRRTLEAAGWLKRYAQAVLKAEAGGD